MLDSAESNPPGEGGNAAKLAERENRSVLDRPSEVRLRQKKESDERLKALRDGQ